MELHTQLIVHRDSSDHVSSILDSNGVQYSEIQTFSTGSVDTIIWMVQNAPWESIAAVIGSFCVVKAAKIKAKSRKKVVITYPDNSRVEITGDNTLEEIEQILHPHKQLYISMYEERKINDE